MTEISKRELFGGYALGAGLGVGALALLAQTQHASADQAFTGFAFPTNSGIGATALRTLPARLSEIKNVRDFGATGDGITDDQPMIQAAINWSLTQPRWQGVIFFPPGIYKVNNPVDFSFGSSGGLPSINFMGVGHASTITGGFANRFVLERGGSTQQGAQITIEKLRIVNGATLGGGIKYASGTVTGHIRDCEISADRGISCGELTPGAPDVNQSPYSVIIDGCRFYAQHAWVSGTFAVAIQENSAIRCCDFNAYDHGIRIAGSGNSVTGGRIEVCNKAIVLGAMPSGDQWSASGFALIGISFESNGIAIECYSASNGLIAGCISNAFPGGAPGSTNPQYGIHVPNGGDNLRSTLIAGCQMAANFDQAAIAVADAGVPSSTRSNNVFMGCTAINNTGLDWRMPTSAGVAKFIGCNTDEPRYTFANLPTSGFGRFIGDEFLISDSSLTPAGNFWAAVTAGAAGLAKVRWDGSNWRIC